MKKLILAALFLLTLSIFTFAQNNIRQIDFNNFTYQTYCADENMMNISVANSEYQQNVSEDFASRLSFKIFSISYGDLDNDGKDEAFVLSLCNRGSDAYISEGFVYTLRNGKPMLLTRIYGGDRARGGLRAAKFERGTFIVEKYIANENDNACCPEFYVEASYKWNGKELVETGISVPRDVYPSTPIEFEKGKNVVNLNVNIPASRMKRYSIKARANQILTITTDSKSIAANVLRGSADVNENGKSIIAVLYENGEYIIQFDNISGANTEALVRLELK